MALHPGLTDLSRLSDDRSEAPVGVGGQDPRDATLEFGIEAVEKVVERIVEQTRALLETTGR